MNIRYLFIILLSTTFSYAIERINYDNAFHIKGGFAFSLSNENGYELSLSYEKRIKKSSLEFGISGAGFFESFSENAGNTTFFIDGKEYNVSKYTETWRDYTTEVFILINHRMDIMKHTKNRAIFFNLWQYGFTFNFYVFGEKTTDLNYIEFYSKTEDKKIKHTLGSTYRPSFGIKFSDRFAMTIEGAAGFGIPIFADNRWRELDGVYGIGLGAQFFK